MLCYVRNRLSKRNPSNRLISCKSSTFFSLSLSLSVIRNANNAFCTVFYYAMNSNNVDSISSNKSFVYTASLIPSHHVVPIFSHQFRLPLLLRAVSLVRLVSQVKLNLSDCDTVIKRYQYMWPFGHISEPITRDTPPSYHKYWNQSIKCWYDTHTQPNRYPNIPNTRTNTWLLCLGNFQIR